MCWKLITALLTIGVLGFYSRRGWGIFLFNTVSRTHLGPTQPPIQWIPGALSRGVKRPGREADHSPPSSAEVKECVELYTSTLQYALMAWCLVKHRDNFTFTFIDINEGPGFSSSSRYSDLIGAVTCAAV
jgi:hypothetical protein